MRKLYDALPNNKKGVAVRSVDEVVQPLLENLKDGDTVLLKGSNGMKLFTLLEKLNV